MILRQQAINADRARNIAHTRKNSAKVEQFLMQVERDRGFAKSWELRERLERGDVRLGQLNPY